MKLLSWLLEPEAPAIRYRTLVDLLHLPYNDPVVQEAQADTLRDRLPLIGLIVVKFLYQLFFFNATGEEAGWRGFALPRMQSSIRPLASCLVINLFWPLKHFFLWEAEGRPVFSFAYWGQSYLELLPATVTLGWIYNRSKGSIVAAGIGDAAANTAFAFFTDLDSQVYVWTTAAAALVMILIDQMWKKLPHDHPAVYHRLEPEVQTCATPTPLPTHP